jgi:hypothetical protein
MFTQKDSSHHHTTCLGGSMWTQILRLGTQICCHASISMDCLGFSTCYGLLPNTDAQAYSKLHFMSITLVFDDDFAV